MGVPHTEKGKSLFSKLLPSTNLFPDNFQRFLKHLRKALTQSVPVFLSVFSLSNYNPNPHT